MILVESPNPLITKEAHQYKKRRLIWILQLALHTTEVAWEPCLSVYCSILKRNHKRSKTEGLKTLDQKGEVVRPVHQVLPLQGPIILQIRV